MTIHIVSDQIIRETVREISGYQKKKIDSDFDELCRCQPDLTAFFTKFVQKFRQKTIENSLFLFFVINLVFEKSAATEMQPITYDEIEQALEKNETLLSGIKGAHDRFLERIAGVRLSTQPHLIRYVIESLESDNDPAAGYLFFVFIVVIDVLNDAFQNKNMTP